MVDFAKKAETMPGADFLCLHFESADPNGANRSVADCVADAKAVAEATTMPIVVMGCKNIEKDGELFSKIAEALQEHSGSVRPERGLQDRRCFRRSGLRPEGGR
jgi:acetyl-CoA decarbonylase/synthase complex subunit delta